MVAYKKGECVYCMTRRRAVRQKLRHAVSIRSYHTINCRSAEISGL